MATAIAETRGVAKTGDERSAVGAGALDESLPGQRPAPTMHKK